MVWLWPYMVNRWILEVRFNKKMANLFPDLDKEEVFQNVSKRWNLNTKLPLPKWDIECPVCSASSSEGKVQARQWQFHKRRTKTDKPYRCDISLKCCRCSHTFTFGLVIPEAIYQKQDKKIITWREARKILNSSKEG